MVSPSQPILVDEDEPSVPSTSSPPTLACSLFFTSVWDFVTKAKDDELYHKCQCGVQLTKQPKGSTGNVINHLQDVHKLKRRKVVPSSPGPAPTPVRGMRHYYTSITPTVSASPHPLPTTEQRRHWTGELLRLVVEVNASFRSVTESAVLRQFMRRELQWEMPSRTVLRRLLPGYYYELMGNLRTQLHQVESISITTDSTFLTRHQVPYICITGHWIDSSWTLHHTVLAVFLAEQGETGPYIANRLREVLEVHLGLSEKVHCVVTDEGKNFLSAVTILKQTDVLRESLRCACHRIQLMVKGAMQHNDCIELMAMVAKCQAITLQFKNGWVSKKRDILRLHQDRYVAGLRADVERLQSELAAHATRVKETQLTEAEKLLQDAEESKEAYEQERKEEVAVDTEVRELTVGTERSGPGVDESDSDADDENTEANDGKEIKEKDDGKEEMKEKAPFNIDKVFSGKEELKDIIAYIQNKRALVQLAATRWMTSVNVVERTLMWRTPLRQALDEIASNPAFRKNSKLDPSALRISDDEATVLQQFLSIGQQCRKTLVELEADNHSTIGALLYHHTKLFEYLTRLSHTQSLDHRIQRFCSLAAEGCAVKFNAQIDRPALIGTALDPRFRTLSFLSASEGGKCKDALATAFAALELKTKDSTPVRPAAPNKKRKRMWGVPVDDEVDFDIDAEPSDCATTQSELQRYQALSSNENRTSSPLDWWRDHAKTYPVLAQLARRYLAIPASSASSERLFSKLKITATPARQNMKSDTLCMLLFVGAHHSR